MAFRELVSPTLTDMFEADVKDMILCGELKVGEKLPTERELANTMKVSLAVVNGGIMRLASRGFLRVVPRKGVFVADYVREGNISTLESLLDYTGSHFYSDMLEAVVEFQKNIEVRTVEGACRNPSEEFLARLEQLICQFEAESDFSALCEIGFQIHHEIALASGNMVYPLMVMTFKIVYIPFYRSILQLGGKDDQTRMLRLLLEGIRTQDATVASLVLLPAIEYWAKKFQLQAISLKNEIGFETYQP